MNHRPCQRPPRGPRARPAGALPALAILLLLSSFPAGAQEARTGTVAGRVTDAASLRPLSDVEVEVEGSRLVLSDADGFFVLDSVPTGPRRLTVRHVAYGEHVRHVLVTAGEELRLDVRISRRAIALAPLVVEAVSELERRRRSQGTSMRDVERPEIDQAAREGRSLAQLLQNRLPGTTIRPGRFGGVCLETRGARRGGSTCREVGVILDGVPVSNPGLLYTTMPLSDLQRVELLSAAEAGARYGSAGAYGMLIIETRRGPPPAPPLRSGALVTGFDWSAEAEPYAWLPVLGSSFVGNAVGLAIGFALADHCLSVEESGSLGLRTRCGGLATVSAGFLSVGLPALGGGLAARWSGTTERSRGRLTPSSLAAAMGLTAGWLMVIHDQTGIEAAGVVVLTLGVPVLMTLSDRVFRALR